LLPCAVGIPRRFNSRAIAALESRSGWTDTVTGDQRREGSPMRRTPTAVSGMWLFLLSSLARRNGLLSFRLGARRK